MLVLTDDQVEIAFEIHGTGVPVVFVHGLGDDRTLFRSLINGLVDTYRCILLDLRGHGASGNSSDNDPFELHRDIAAVTKQLRIMQPILVGHSLGALAVSTYAARHDALAVVNLDQCLEWSPLTAMVMPYASEVARGEGSRILCKMLEQLGVEALDSDLRFRLRQTRSKLDEAVVRGVWKPLFEREPAMNNALVATALAGLDVPYLSLHGAEVEPDYVDWLRGIVPNAQIEVWPSAGHFLHLADETRFVGRLREFFDSVLASVHG